MAGGTGSSLRQRKTERSRWGTPCCTYRMWILSGCVRQGAPCFFFVIYPMYQTAYSYGRNNSSLPCHDLTLSVGEPDNAAAQTGAGTSFGATGAPLHEQSPSTYFLCLNNSETFVELVGAKPLHLACARPLRCLKAPLGLSLMRCTSQMRSHPKPCSYSHLCFQENHTGGIVSN